MKLFTLVGLAALMSLFVSAPASAQYGSTLNPADYESPSGRHRMHVEPTDRLGEKPCDVTMYVDGKVAWERSIEPAFWQAGVTDEGVAFGIGYIHDFPDPERPRMRGPVTRMRIVRIEPDGYVEIIEEQECTYPRGLSRCGFNIPNYPYAMRLALQPVADTMVVCIQNSYEEDRQFEWWRFRISEGVRLDDADPMGPYRGERVLLRAIETKSIPSTPLVLEEWARHSWDDSSTKITTMLVVCTTDGVVHWAGEYEPPEDDESGVRRDPRDSSRPAVTLNPGGFTVTTPDQAETIAYLCAPDRTTDAWSMVAIGRELQGSMDRMGSRPVASDNEPEPAQIIGTISLDTFEPEKPLLWDILDFDIGSDGVIGVLRRVGAKGRFLTFFKQDGEVVADRELTEIVGQQAKQIAAMSRGRWLITGPGYEDGEASVVIFDPRTDTVEAPHQWDGGFLREPVGLADGGFLGFSGAESYSVDDLVSFDRLGRERWRVTDIFSPEDIVVDRSGRILVLENISEKIKYFSAAGDLLKVIEMEDVVDEEMQYPTVLIPTVDGGVICSDNPADEPFIRLDRNGAFVERFKARHEDGWTFTHHYTIRPTEDGSFWVTDRTSLIRIDANGVWERVLGDKPWDAPLRQLGALALGRGDTPHVVNARADSLHVFDAEGREQGILMPEPGMFLTRVGSGAVTIAGDGRVCFGAGDLGRGKYAAYAADHAPLMADERAPLLPDSGGEWRFVPGANERWQVDRRSVFHVNAHGETDVELERTPGGDWLGYIDSMAIARDGSVAVISSGEYGDRSGRMAHLYRRDGVPVGSVHHGFEDGWYGDAAYAPPYVIFAKGDRIRFVHEIGARPTVEVEMEASSCGESRHRMELVVPEREGEVWVWGRCSGKIIRVAIPE